MNRRCCKHTMMHDVLESCPECEHEADIKIAIEEAGINVDKIFDAGRLEGYDDGLEEGQAETANKIIELIAKEFLS